MLYRAKLGREEFFETSSRTIYPNELYIYEGLSITTFYTADILGDLTVGVVADSTYQLQFKNSFDEMIEYFLPENPPYVKLNCLYMENNNCSFKYLWNKSVGRVIQPNIMEESSPIKCECISKLYNEEDIMNCVSLDNSRIEMNFPSKKLEILPEFSNISIYFGKKYGKDVSNDIFRKLKAISGEVNPSGMLNRSAPKLKYQKIQSLFQKYIAGSLELPNGESIVIASLPIELIEE